MKEGAGGPVLSGRAHSEGEPTRFLETNPQQARDSQPAATTSVNRGEGTFAVTCHRQETEAQAG